MGRPAAHRCPVHVPFLRAVKQGWMDRTSFGRTITIMIVGEQSSIGWEYPEAFQNDRDE
jgi:hypothetical protein